MRSLVVLISRAMALAVGLLLLAGTGAAAAGAWQAPLSPMRVTRGFEPPPTPYAAGHRGVDLAGVVGEPVRSAAAGVVSYAGLLAGRGVVVVVHGALRTTYEPVQAAVRRGTEVSKGQQIGTLEPGHAGCPVAACLHWGLLRGDTYLNPMGRLGAQRVRLLPLTGRAPPTPRSMTLTAAAGPSGSATRTGAPLVNAGVTWSVAALAGFGVVIAGRRR